MMVTFMYLILLLLVMIILYPFSLNHFFSPSHPDLLFIFAHSSTSHLLMNSLSIFLLYLISWKLHINEKKLIMAFLLTSFASLFISYLFDLPVLGSSVGIYGMVGFILPELSAIVPLWLSYSLIFLGILMETAHGLPWEKLFHIFGLTFGVVVRFFLDYRNIAYMRNLISMGYDRYALIGVGYFPGSYVVEYKIKKE